MSNLKLNPSIQNILDLLLVIDTENLKENYRNPSRDSEHPTAIDEKYYSILCADYDGIKQSQQNKLDLKVIISDIIRLKGVSLSQNCDDAVILYDTRTSGVGVINDLYKRPLDISVVGPNTSSDSNSLPAQNYNAKFKILQYTLVNTGTERVAMSFAVYERHRYSQELYGYFTINVDIVVSSK